ncbi:methyltransferase domain-containing protein [Aquirufa novilacunae]|uniref:Methyltransferase domain-containing protein n=1 Tax=Aquirufa novilacunae TaxID=3139305 RepID=A0ABW8U672_9BACT
MNIQNSLKEKNGRLHVACGAKNYKEYVNVDLFDFDARDTSRDGSSYDFKEDLTRLDSIENGSVSEILFIHGFEHFARYDAIHILRNWYEKLESGGIVHCEMPDFDRVFLLSFLPKWVMNRNSKRYNKSIAHDMFYGNQWSGLDYETHRYLWSKHEFRTVLEELGFTIQYSGNAAFFHVPFRDLIIVASKGDVPHTAWKTRLIGGVERKLSLLHRLKRIYGGLIKIFF